jgi:hypothetical protein
MERFEALLSGSEEEAIARLRVLREEHQGHMRVDIALRILTIQAEAHRMRDVLASVRSEAKTHCNPAALLSERVMPMRLWHSSYEHFRGVQRAICESYPSNCDHFDWKAHLDALDAAVDADEAAALAA